MTSFPWVDFGRLLIYCILGLSLKDNGKKNSVAILLRSDAILTRLISYSCRRNQLYNQGNEICLVHQQNHLHFKNGLLHCVR